MNNLRNVAGIAMAIDIVSSEKNSLELESKNKGRIKFSLLRDLKINASLIESKSKIFIRTNGVIIFIEKNKYSKNSIVKTINDLVISSKNIIKAYNTKFEKNNLFQASFGAEYSEKNVLFNFRGNEEIIGVSVNVAYKIASDKANGHNLFIGDKLSQFVSVLKNDSFNAVNGIHYPAYRENFINNSNCTGSCNPKYLMSLKEGRQESNEGAIFVMVDIPNSTKALIFFDITEIAHKWIAFFEEITREFDGIYFKNEFRGDGLLFWKLNIKNSLTPFQNVITTVNRIVNDKSFQENRKIKDAKHIKEKLGIEINNIFKLKVGIDAGEKYNYTTSSEPPICVYKIMAEIAEKATTKEYKIVSGESFLSKLYMNHKDYSKTIKVIDGYNLKALINEYLERSADQYKTGWRSKIFSKSHSINFSSFISNDQDTKVKNFGAEARAKNSIELRKGNASEDAEFNGLHFYIASDKKILQVFINDGRGKYIEWSK